MICPLLHFPHRNSPYIFIQDAPLPHNVLPAAAKRRTTFCQNGMVTYMPNYYHSVNVAWTCYIPVSCAVSPSRKTFFFFFLLLLSLYFWVWTICVLQLSTSMSGHQMHPSFYSTLNIASFYSPSFSAKSEYPHQLTTWKNSFVNV